MSEQYRTALGHEITVLLQQIAPLLFVKRSDDVLAALTFNRKGTFRLVVYEIQSYEYGDGSFS